MSYRTERRALQAAIALACLVPIGGGVAGVVAGPEGFSQVPAGVSFDSHFRYLSGLLLAVGVAFAAVIPRIERATVSVRLLGSLVICGGLARLVSLLLEGRPSTGMTFALVMELVVTPLLCLWQNRIARLESSRLR